MKLRIRQIIYILLAISAFALLIAVVTNSQSPESLMVPPEAAGDYKEIQDVIKDSVDSGIILKAPNEGDFTTAITFADINLDGENDAIAFYRLNNDDTSSIYMSVLIKKDSKWIASNSIKGKGNDILEFSYGDLNYDSVPEIIVGWSMFDSKDNNSLCVYSVDTKKDNNPVNLDDSLIYTKMFVDDICLEGKKEILLVKNTYNDENADAKATVYELVDSKAELERRLGKKVTALCFPVGYFSDEVIRRCKTSGYETVYASYPGDVTDDYVQPRCLVQDLSVGEFKSVLNGGMNLLERRYLKRHKVDCK